MTIAFWTGVSPVNGKTYATGKIHFPNLNAGVEAKAAAKATPLELPSDIKLEFGKAILFKDTKYKGKYGAHWYGYGHEGKQIVRYDAHEYNASVLVGSVRPWRPKHQEAATQGDAPDVV